jgi:hypothetical protein
MNALQEWLNEKCNYVAAVDGITVGQSSSFEGACNVLWGIGRRYEHGYVYRKDGDKVAEVFKGKVVQYY